jgi:hypothetical protein
VYSNEENQKAQKGKVYSKDAILNDLMGFFVECTNGEIKEELEKFWIEQQEEEDSPTNADNKEYIVQYNLALDDVIRQVAEVFAIYFTMNKFKPAKDESLFYHCGQVMFNNLEGLRDCNAFDYDLAEELLPEEVLEYYNEKCENFYRVGSMFLLARETGYKILHNRRALFYTAVSCGLEVPNESHQEEFDADRFAVDFILKNLYNKPFLDSSISSEYISGPLILVIAIALLTDDACEYTSVHPSVQERWNNIVDAIQPYCSPNELNILTALFSTINDYIQGHLHWWKSEWWI